MLETNLEPVPNLKSTWYRRGDTNNKRLATVLGEQATNLRIPAKPQKRCPFLMLEII